MEITKEIETRIREITRKITKDTEFRKTEEFKASLKELKDYIFSDEGSKIIEDEKKQLGV